MMFRAVFWVVLPFKLFVDNQLTRQYNPEESSEQVYNLFSFLKLIPDCTSLTGPPKKLAPDKTLHMLLMTRKSPLSKSLSMPEMETRVKKRERLMV
jgi:hypothetical protein